MRYTTKEACLRYRINPSACGNIHVSGSVLGMQKRFGWERSGQVRIGSWVYNIGPQAVATLRSFGEIRGER